MGTAVRVKADLRRFDSRPPASALVTKESYQMRDPSTPLIAFVPPVVLLLLFAYAVSLDAKDVRVGGLRPSASAQSLAAAFSGTALPGRASVTTDAKWLTSWCVRSCAATWSFRRTSSSAWRDVRQRAAGADRHRTALTPIPPTTSKTTPAAWCRAGAPGLMSRHLRSPWY